MGRLTVKDEFGYLPKDMTGISCDDYCTGDCSTCLIQACFDKLGRLEDMEEQEPDKIKEPTPATKEPDGNVYWINDKGHIVAARLSSLETGRVGNTITYNGPTLYRSAPRGKGSASQIKGGIGMRYKAGDKVRIRPDIKEGDCFHVKIGDHFQLYMVTKEMAKRCGRTVTIEMVGADGYGIAGDERYTYTEDMLV